MVKKYVAFNISLQRDIRPRLAMMPVRKIAYSCQPTGLIQVVIISFPVIK